MTKTLSVETKLAVVMALRSIRRCNLFGDGMEDDYIMEGCVIIGLKEMEDFELVQELEESVGHDDLVVAKAKKELE